MERDIRKELITLLLESVGKEDKCEWCGKSDVSVSHRLPLFQGGLNKLDNVDFLCKDCMKNSHRLNFIHGDENSYRNVYQKWYWETHPEQYKKHKKNMREYGKSIRAKNKLFLNKFGKKALFI